MRAIWIECMSAMTTYRHNNNYDGTQIQAPNTDSITIVGIIIGIGVSENSVCESCVRCHPVRFVSSALDSNRCSHQFNLSVIFQFVHNSMYARND